MKFNPFAGKIGFIFGKSRYSEPGNQLKVQQTRSEALGNGIRVVGEIFDEHIRNGVLPVNQIEHFQRGPYVLEIAERAVAAALAFFPIQQQCAKANIYAYISRYDQRIAVCYAAGNTIRHVAAI